MNDQPIRGDQDDKAALLDKVCAIVAERVPKGERDDVARFVRHFFHDVPPLDLAQHDAEELYGAALSFWKFVGQRAPGEAKVHVYNPALESHGWKSVHTIVQVATEDMPFLVDSVSAELNRQGLTIHLTIHPIVFAKRGDDGTLEDFATEEPDAGGYLAESLMLLQIDEQTARPVLREIETGLKQVLADVRAAVEDWSPMCERLREVIQRLHDRPPKLEPDEVAEGRAFLEWLLENNFTFLGYREYRIESPSQGGRIEVDAESGLGVLRDPEFHVFEGSHDTAKLPPEALVFLSEPRLLVISKANKRATVHRAVHMDAIGVKMFDDAGRVTGECMFVGLFTSDVYYRSPYNIPYVRRKLEAVRKRAGHRPQSHDAKALQHILATFPRDELFQVTVDDLYRIAIGILQLQERQRIALFERRDPFQRFVSCLVFAPREGFSTELRYDFTRVLERAYNGRIAAFDTRVSDDIALARIHFIIKTEPGNVPDVDPADVEAELAEAARSWADKLEDELIEMHGEEEGLRLMRRYGSALPSNYREAVTQQNALIDLDHIERVVETGELGLNMYRPIEAAENRFRFKIYNGGSPVPLSDVLPMLENMGVRVIDEVPYQVRPSDCDPVWIHDFGLAINGDGALELGEVRDDFHECFARTWRGEMESDGFNTLVLAGRLNWRQIVVLRAYAKYMRQAGVPFSQHYIQETLTNNPGIAAWLLDLFDAKFRPPGGKSERIRQEAAHQIEAALEDVASLDEDRIIRKYVNLIQATLRTNFYQNGPGGAPKEHLSLKLDSRAIEDLPLPRPMVEIWVYSPGVEGVHLRFGKVARGGLRWSDRREDFRTEVLGLAKAQVVKNAVIVPVGSKGGFVVKRPPAGADRAALQEEGIECYKTFVRGMLDLTDNLVEGEISPPPDVARLDDDDPYLVVAADKGTATFSDIANGVAADYDFWLGDAFASGGSAGYDHKEMGITARGGWEAVKRHFRELGKNIQDEDFTVVGVGDMSGDVFGNGMLLSRHIKLIAAFNHLHIFVDPKPDPEKSYEERKRLFEMERSGWNDYDESLISAGGGVFSRSAKSITVSAEMRALFDIAKNKVTPAELIRAILRSDVELLWFGGIGTYIKAPDERDAEVGDRSNDAVRVDADEVGAKVIGEGANLAVTQRGRIAFARRGGHINTDAIDNSGGVDCSDHEVNIKILLREVVDSGDMTLKQRNQLLEKMTAEVAELVLRDNYLQTGCISVTERIAPRLLDRHGRFIRTLERAGHLNREVEGLPTEEVIAERHAVGQGLTRPEIAVLLAYAKIDLFGALLESDLPDDPALTQDLIDYFPTPLRKKYREAAMNHRLRREIIATTETNNIVNRAGITFIHDVAAETGHPPQDIARAFIIARDVFRLRDIWHGVEALDNVVDAGFQLHIFHRAGQLVKRLTSWFLRNGDPPLEIQRHIDGYQPGIANFLDVIDEMLPEAEQRSFAERLEELAGEGLPDDLARRIGAFDYMLSGCDVVRIAERSEIDMAQAGRLYFRIGEALQIEWLRDAAVNIAPGDYWDKLAITALIDELYTHQCEVTCEAFAMAEDKTAPAADIFANWEAAHQALVDRARGLIDDIRGADSIDLAMIAVANRQIRALVAA